MKELTLTLPVRLVLAKNKEKGKRYYLNMNNYRAAHHQVLAGWKREFSALVGETIVKHMGDLAALAENCPLTLTYMVYPFQKSDPANVGAIIDKFFCDVLQEYNVIPDDDHEHIGEVRIKFGAVDRQNPRCEVTISHG